MSRVHFILAKREDLLYNMIELTEEEFKGDLDKYTLRIENGEDFLIKKSSGEKYIATDITKFQNTCDI